MAWHDIQTSNWPTSGCWSICGLCSADVKGKIMLCVHLEVNKYVDQKYSSWFWHLFHTCYVGLYIDLNAEQDIKIETDWELSSCAIIPQPNRKHALLIGVDIRENTYTPHHPSSRFTCSLTPGKPIKSDAKSKIPPREALTHCPHRRRVCLAGHILLQEDASVPRIRAAVNLHFYTTRAVMLPHCRHARE